MDIDQVGHRQYARHIARRDWWREFVLGFLIPLVEIVFLFYVGWALIEKRGLASTGTIAGIVGLFVLGAIILPRVHREIWKMARRMCPACCIACRHFEEEYTILWRPMEDHEDCGGSGRIIILGEEEECFCVGPTLILCAKCATPARDVAPLGRRIRIITNGGLPR